MNANLDPKLQEYINQKVNSGAYQSEAEVLADALLHLKFEDDLIEDQENNIETLIMDDEKSAKEQGWIDSKSVKEKLYRKNPRIVNFNYEN